MHQMEVNEYLKIYLNLNNKVNSFYIITLFCQEQF